MTLKELIAEIKKLNSVEQHRLKAFFINSIASFSASEPVFQEVTERKNKDGYTCVHCSSKQVVRFGKYKVKLGLKKLNVSDTVVKITENLLLMLPLLPFTTPISPTNG